MKRKLLLMALATAMVASVFTGCGKDAKDDTTNPSSAIVEDVNGGDNTNVNDSNKEDATSKVEEVKGYDEVFYDEPDWEAMYEEEKNAELEAGAKLENAEIHAEGYVIDKKLEYYAMKFVFEDMTQKFKNEETVTAIEGIEGATSFVCDIANVIPEDFVMEDGDKVIYDRESYKEFGGFDIKKTEADVVRSTSGERDKYGRRELDCIKVWIRANKVQVGDIVGNDYYPMTITAYVILNEDGTYTYKDIKISYELYEMIYATE